jgi:hypothetical protein
LTRVSIHLGKKHFVKRMGVKPGNDDIIRRHLPGAAVSRRLHTTITGFAIVVARHFLSTGRQGRNVMAKGQMRSNKEKKKPKADKNLKKGGAAPVNPFAAGKTLAGQSPNSKKS